MEGMNEMTTDRYDSASILADITRPCVLEIYDSLPSTSDWLKARRASSKDWTIILADAQSEGRGTKCRSFYSPEASGIYMSILIKEGPLFEHVFDPACIAGLAVCQALRHLYDVRSKVKWVNDVLIEDKKVAGVLCERIHDGQPNMVIGIGINLHSIKMPENLPEAACVEDFTDVYHSRNEVVAEIIRTLDYYLQASDALLRTRYRSRLSWMGEKVAVYDQNTRQTGRLVDIDKKGQLIVRLEGKDEPVVLAHAQIRPL